jgi:hypothetical protein
MTNDFAFDDHAPGARTGFGRLAIHATAKSGLAHLPGRSSGATHQPGSTALQHLIRSRARSGAAAGEARGGGRIPIAPDRSGDIAGTQHISEQV